MKKIIQKIGVMLVATAVISSCAKQIDLTPQFNLDASKPLQNLEQADFALTGAYNGFQGVNYFNAGANNAPASFSCLPDMMSDDLTESLESLGNYRAQSEWTYVSNDPLVETTWLGCYNTISTVNAIIRDIDGLAVQDTLRAHKIKGQALAIRAMVHFDLLRLFAPDLDRNSTAPGIPYVKKFDVTATPARNTVKECYDAILADVDESIRVLSLGTGTPINSSSKRSRIDLTAVYALAARVNLYANQWQKAIDAATYVINAVPLANPTEFRKIWTDESVSEVIWAATFENSDGRPYDNVFFATGNRSSYRPSPELRALYNAAADVRYISYFASVGTFNGVPQASRFVVSKYIGKVLGGVLKTDGVVNWKAFRVSEMYLIRAEASYNLGNETAARNDLNSLRAARIAGFTPGTETGNVLYTAILTERRKELAFEGHRFFDFKRLNHTPINRCSVNTNTPSTICSLASNNRAWAWPIPYAEMNANPNIQQNNGY